MAKSIKHFRHAHSSLNYLYLVHTPSCPKWWCYGPFGIYTITKISWIACIFLFAISAILSIVSSGAAFRSLHFPLHCYNMFILTRSGILSSNCGKLCQIMHLEILNYAMSPSITSLRGRQCLTLSFYTFSPTCSLNRMLSSRLCTRQWYAEGAIVGSHEIGGFQLTLGFSKISERPDYIQYSIPEPVQIRSI